MKSIFKVFLVLMISANAFAATDEPARVLTDLRVTEVTDGEILKRNHRFPVESLLVGLQAEVSTGNVCTDFVGQTLEMDQGRAIIEVKGSVDPMVDACIEIAPMPVETVLTVPVRVFSMAVDEVTHFIQDVVIDGQTYTMDIDLKTGEVKVKAQ